VLLAAGSTQRGGGAHGVDARAGPGFILGLWLACPSVGQPADAIPPAVDIEVFIREGGRVPLACR